MKKNIVFLIIALAMFMEAVDSSVLNTAIPVMSLNLRVSPIDLKLALISYLLSLAIFIPISGWLADKYGAKKVFMVAVGIFTLSSIACGITQTLSQLVLARIFQGLGGALTLPVGRLIIIRICERHEIISKMSIVIMIASVGMLLGPLIGGFITSHWSWRWIFWVNAPVGLVILILSIHLLPHFPQKYVFALDKIGFILFGSGLSILTLGLSLLSESHIHSIYPMGMLVFSCLLLLSYLLYSKKIKHPVVDLSLFKIRTFQVACIGNLTSRIGFGGMPFLLPLLLQIGFHWSPELSGLLLAPIALGVFTVKSISTWILKALGYKKLLMVNSVFIAAILASFSGVNSQSSLWLIASLTFLYGFLIAAQYTAMNSLAYAQVPEEKMSNATSIMSTIQQLGISFGVGIAAVIIQFFAYTQQSELNVSVFHYTFMIIAGITVLSLFIFNTLHVDDGKELLIS